MYLRHQTPLQLRVVVGPGNLGTEIRHLNLSLAKVGVVRDEMADDLCRGTSP